MNSIIKTGTTTHNVLFAEVPKEVKEISLVYWPDSDTGYTMIYYDGIQQEYQPGDWELMTDDSTKVTEETSKTFVDFNDKTGFYMAYASEMGFIWNTALESYASLKASVGVVDVNPLGEKPIDSNPSRMDTYQDHELKHWQSAEARVKRYAVLIQKK